MRIVPVDDQTVAAGDILLLQPLDIPSKSWDRKKLLALYPMLSVDAEEKLALWLKDRYLSRCGKSTKRIELLIGILTNSKITAAIKVCRTKDFAVLEIPVYRVAPDDL